MANSLKTALIANLLIAAIKTILGFISNSSAMFSEAAHSLADTINQLLLALGIRRSKKRPDLEHPFGYSKIQFFWAFVVAILIFGISGTFAFIEGVSIVINPAEHHIETDKLYWNLIALFSAILLEGYALRTAMLEVKHFKQKFKTKSLIKTLDEMQDPVLLSVLTEDSLAIIGLIIAFIGMIITVITKQAIWDGITSILIGLVLASGGIALARENKSYLIGKALNQREQEAIMNALKSIEEIEEIIAMKTMLLGVNDLILALDLKIKDKFETTEIGELIDKIENILVKTNSKLRTDKIFIEVQ